MSKVRLYGFLAQEFGKEEVNLKTKGKTPKKILRAIEKKIDTNLFEKGGVIPTLLVLINGREYRSLGLLDTKLDGEEEVKLIPTFHGGKSYCM